MKSIHLYLLLACTFLYTACNNDDKGYPYANFPGYYEIKSITSSELMDINNDGIQSRNILGQMAGVHIIDGTAVPFFYIPDQFLSLAEVRPLPEHTNNYRLIDLKFPYPLFANETAEEPCLLCYTSIFRTFSYDLKSDNTIEFIDSNPEYTSQFGKINSAVRKNKDSFEVDISVRLYDFKDKKWKETIVITTYEKREDYPSL